MTNLERPAKNKQELTNLKLVVVRFSHDIVQAGCDLGITYTRHACRLHFLASRLFRDAGAETNRSAKRGRGPFATARDVFYFERIQNGWRTTTGRSKVFMQRLRLAALSLPIEASDLIDPA
jgi:hypothetical protein